MLETTILRYGGVEVSPLEVYGDMFRLGDGFIQVDGEKGGEHKANPIILGSFNGKVRRRIMFEDTFEKTLEEFQQADWAIINGLTYWGKRNTADAQSKMCAMIFDLDGVRFKGGAGLVNLLYGAVEGGLYPVPQYVILSGHNVHLYYVFEEPLSLYPSTKLQLKELKYALTDLMWNSYTSSIEKPQHQGINQGFRIIGGRTKDGDTVRAFRLNSHPTTIDELNEYVPESVRVDVARVYRESRYTLDQARELFPEWYESVVVHGEPRVWYQKGDLYNWWLRKISTPYIREGNIGGRHVGNAGVTYGHRYFCIMALAVFAVKCGITDRKRVKEDAMGVLGLFNHIGPEPFLESDIDSALECLDLKYIKFPRRDLEKITAVEMPSNKRNGRKQSLHLKMARSNLEILNEDAGHALQGRPKGSPNKEHPKRDAIRSYAADHPGESQRQIAKALGVSPTTVNKWLKPGWRDDHEARGQSVGPRFEYGVVSLDDFYSAEDRLI